MNDALYEQLIARRPKPYDLPVRILVILVIVAVAVLGMPFLGVLSFVIAVILAVVAYYFIFPKRLKWPLLLLASYFFYMIWNPPLIFLILF